MSFFKRTLARWYFTYFPLEKGKWTVWVKLRSGLNIPANTEVVRTKFGFQMKIDPKEHIDKFIYFWGVWEPNETWLMQQLLSPGDVYVDVGAHVGYHSLLGSALVGASGEVHAFEPVPPSLELLNEHLQMNGVKNVRVYPNAVADKAGKVRIGKPGGTGSQNNTLRVDPDSQDYWEVDAVTLDDVLPPDKPIKYLKVDVEGAEWLVMNGFKKHLEKQNPPYILLEFNDEWLKSLGGSSERLYDLMISYGYKAHDCRNLRFTPIPREKLPKSGLIDILFANKELND